MNLPRLKVMVSVCLIVVSTAGAQDWPQWRGPNRNGLSSDKVTLAESWPEAGPTRLWTSETIPGAGAGGYGSPVVANGRVFVYVNWKYSVPIPARTLSEANLHSLGWVAADRLPEALLKALDEARLGEERAKVEPKELNAWVDKWLKDHLNDEQRKTLGQFCAGRLRKGKAAFAMDDLNRLAGIKDKEFTSQAEFEKWLDASGVADDLRKAVIGCVTVSRNIGKDVIFCLDAADGKTVWRKEYDPVGLGVASSSTPCIADGKCYVAGADGAIYCLDAEDGAEVWARKVAGGVQHSSPLLVDGLVVAMSEPTFAVNARDGNLAWQQPKARSRENSAVVWNPGGKNYLLCNSGGGVHCLDAATGGLLWTAPGRGYSTAVVAGDVMVVQTDKKEVGLAAYTLSPTNAERLWNVDFIDRGASPIVHDGYVYNVGKGRALCVSLADGKIAWDGNPGGGEISSPVLADGKIYAVVDGGKNLAMLRASPAKYELLGKAKMGILTCTSPAIANGRLYVRLNNHIACYDLTGTVPATQPADTPPAGK